MNKRLLFFLFLALPLWGCHRVSSTIEPTVRTPCHPKEIYRQERLMLTIPRDFSCSPFSLLTPEECGSDWGKELRIGLCFAADFDLYRAITSFKRALVLIPCENKERRLEIEYDIALAYYLGKKYVEVIFSVENTDLICIEPSYPAFADLLLMLYDSYDQLGREEQAHHIFGLLEVHCPEIACKLNFCSAVACADFCAIAEQAQKPGYDYLDRIIDSYNCKKKSVKKAQMLNAVLPGSGYWYVGQKETAVTAFLINSLFIGTAVVFFDHGNIPAGIITLSLESGWYFGGIYGAGLSAKRYNENLYEGYADKIAQKEKYFPLLMLRFTF